MEPSPLALLVLVAATLVGAAVQAVTGFGFAILAAPAYLAVLNSAEAVPLLAALHIVQSAMLVPALWQKVPRPEFRCLMLGGAIGCPLGLLLYRSLDVRSLKLVAGVVILIAAGLMYLRSRRETPRDPADAGAVLPIATGVLSGALTALLVMPGPPLMLLLMRRPLAPELARALSLAFFAACYIAVTLMSVAAGTLTSRSLPIAALLVVPVIAGTLGGLRFAPMLATRHYMPVLYLLLVLAGAGAIVSAV